MKSLKIALLSLALLASSVAIKAELDDYTATEVSAPVVKVLTDVDEYAFLAKLTATANVADIDQALAECQGEDTRYALEALKELTEISAPNAAVDYQRVVRNTPIELRKKVFYGLFSLFIKAADRETSLNTFITLFSKLVENAEGNFIAEYAKFCNTLNSKRKVSKPSETVKVLQDLEVAAQTLPKEIAVKVEETLKRYRPDQLLAVFNQRIKLNAKELKAAK